MLFICPVTRARLALVYILSAVASQVLPLFGVIFLQDRISQGSSTPPPADTNRPPRAPLQSLSPLVVGIRSLPLDQSVPLHLRAVLHQTERRKQEHHIDRHNAKERREHDVQKRVRVGRERRHTPAQLCRHGGGCAGCVADEDCGVVVAAALEFILQHGLNVAVLLGEEGLEVRLGFQRAEPDVQSDCEGEER